MSSGSKLVREMVCPLTPVPLQALAGSRRTTRRGEHGCERGHDGLAMAGLAARSVLGFRFGPGVAATVGLGRRQRRVVCVGGGSVVAGGAADRHPRATDVLQAQAQGWHSLTGTLAFVGGVAVNASGATVLRSGDNATADAHYDSTFGMSFWSGLRWLFEGVQWPVLPFVRAGIGVDFTAASALVGYRLGPVGGGGLAFPVGEVIDLVGEVEVGLGFGQYRGSGALLAVSLDVLLGLQMRF